MARFKGNCNPKPEPTRCFFCGYGPCGKKFEDMWDLANHCLSKTCQHLMKEQWNSCRESVAKQRIRLVLPTEDNIVKLVEARNFRTLRTIIQKKKDTNKLKRQNVFDFMPSLSSINYTRKLNNLPELDDVPRQRIPEGEVPTTCELPTTSDEATTSAPKTKTSRPLSNQKQLHSFFDKLPNYESLSQDFVVKTTAQDLEGHLAKATAPQHLFHITDGTSVDGLKSSLPDPILNLDFRECVMQMFEDSCMQNEDLNVRHYDKVIFFDL